jgi:hypothetical protein
MAMYSCTSSSGGEAGENDPFKLWLGRRCGGLVRSEGTNSGGTYELQLGQVGCLISFPILWGQ